MSDLVVVKSNLGVKDFDFLVSSTVLNSTWLSIVTGFMDCLIITLYPNNDLIRSSRSILSMHLITRYLK